MGEASNECVADTAQKSLAAAIELSLTSPMFQEFGPDARALLGVEAFFPQGVDENNIDWLFPTITNAIDIFDGFCVLSLTSRSDGFIIMLASLRDYLSPEDPESLCAAKERYFIRMSVDIGPDKPDFKETRWIRSEDFNVEHLLDVFTTIDANADDVWKSCANCMAHLYWHKPRLTLLGPRIKGLPDVHCCKPRCSIELSRLFPSTGNRVECKGVPGHALRLERERGDDDVVAHVLWRLCEANRHMGLYDEGTQQAEEALEICERLGDVAGQAKCLIKLAWLLWDQEQLDAAEEATAHAISLLPEMGEQYQVCRYQIILGNIYQFKGEIENAVYHFEAALEIALSFDWHHELFSIHLSLAALSFGERRFDDASVHAERAKLYVVDNAYNLGHAIKMQAFVWCEQDRFEEARSEALRATEVLKLRFSRGMEICGELLELIQIRLDCLVALGQLRESSSR